MNKIFKIIWSKTLNQLVVTSELSRGESKASSTETAQKERSGKVPALKTAYSALSLALVAALPTSALAGYTTAGGSEGSAVDANSVSIGRKAVSSGASGVSLGGGYASGGEASGQPGIANVSIGYTTASGGGAIAIGSSMAFGNGTIAMGKGAMVGKGTERGSATEAATDSIAIGTKAQAFGIGGVALGANSLSYSDNAVALGSGSIAGYPKAASAVGTSGVSEGLEYNLGGVTDAQNLAGILLDDPSASKELRAGTVSGAYDFAGVAVANTTNGQYDNVVSVGRSAGQQGTDIVLNRQIINVAAGRISADSTDAINGSQLYQVLKYLKDTNVIKPIEATSDNAGAGVAGGGGASSFTIKTANNQTASGNADNTINSTKNQITFGATEDLTVNSEDGKVVYGISDTFKNTMNEAVSKAETAASKAETAASNAASSATAASDSATAASNSATAASGSATAASNSATAASDSASAASDSASAADSSASAASTSASAADSSASAASTSASAADSSASAASTSASAADSSASAASTSASAADSSASAA
ncbi:ESPR-type extended signal peptide-containing protein, partial [Avibacterium avium]|uniref:ESPR-type extended signal peptide-containing protein n=1 Tax=Avibacterium avium TaxID=751 RepID=UPI003BF90CE0